MSYHRTFLLDLNNDSSKYGLDLVCLLKNTNGETVQEFNDVAVEVERGVYSIFIHTLQDDHRGSLLVYSNVGDSSSTSSSSEESLTYLAGFAINPEECEYVKVLYHSEIDLVIDDENAVDRWTVIFFKNGVIIPASRITSPLLTVYNDLGSAFIAAASLTQVSSTNFFRYYASGANRIDPGDNCSAVSLAVVDGNLLTFPRIHGRDT